MVQRKSEARKGSARVQCMRNIEVGWLIWKERDAIEGDAWNPKEGTDGTVEKESGGEWQVGSQVSGGVGVCERQDVGGSLH